MSDAPAVEVRPISSAERPTGIWKWLPGARMLRRYRREWLSHDLVAGLVLTAMLVPAGMGYAEAAGLPPITGLYATIFPLAAYALVGPSRILVLGPDSSLAPLIAAAVLPLAAGDQAETVALAGMLALMTGALCIAAGIARFGFITELLSRPVRYGYMNGIALTVIVSQLPKLFGFSVEAEGFGGQVVAFVQGVLGGETVPAALGIGVVCLGIIFGLKRWAPRVPGVLIAVIWATITVGALGLADRISVVGVIPHGLPGFTVPVVDLADVGLLLAGAIGIALVSFADTSVLSRTYASRGGYRVDSNQEMVALGAANIAGGLFQGFPVSSSSSRTPVAESAGAKTQLTGLVGAVAIAVMLIAAPALVQNLPTTALAAVVISAAIGLFEIAGVRKLFEVRRSEFYLSMAAFLAVTVFGVIAGIGVAVGLSVLDFLRRAWRPHDAILGRADGVKGYHDIGRYPDARQVPGLVLFRWDAPLFFANADLFRARIREVATGADPPARWVIVASEPITDVDTTAAEMIEELDEELAALGIELAFAEMKDPVKDRLRSYGLTPRIGREFFFPTMGVAVKEYLARSDVDWRDWEDGKGRGAP
jgi:high affinity sulfate transporter 1